MYMEAHMIRFLLVCITVIGFLILSIPILIVEWIIGKFNPYKKDISSLHLIQSVFRFILWLTGVEVTVIGEELVPTDEAVLYIGNHRSFFDILLTYTRCPRLTGYIAKAEMEKIPLLSNWMHYLHCLFLDRKDIKKGLKTILKNFTAFTGIRCWHWMQSRMRHIKNCRNWRRRESLPVW